MWYPQGIYSSFLLKQPNILFGKNAIYGLKIFPTARVAVIHGKSLDKKYREDISNGISCYEKIFISKDWVGEPSVESLYNSINKIERFNPDVIIAIGGGGIIDAAKIIRLYYEFPYFDINKPNFSMLNWKSKFIAIPTTIGSGSEISSAAVMYNEKLKTKEFIINHDFIPEIIVMDPILVKNAPKNILFSSMVDAISHSIEGYISRVDNFFAESYAEKALSMFRDNYHSINSDRDEIKILNLQIAALFSSIVQNHCIVGASHSIAHQLSAFKISHSAAISILLPTVIKKNSKNKVVKAKLQKLSKNAGFNNYEEMLLFVENLIDNCDLKSEQKILNKNLNKIMDDKAFFENAIADKGGRGNPVDLNRKFLSEILIDSLK